MKPIYVLGAGGQAKDTAFVIAEINKVKPTYEFRGFIDLPQQADFLERHQSHKADVCLAMGVATPHVLQTLAEDFAGFEFPNLIHPSSLGDFGFFTMGQGNIVAGLCSFTVNATLGSFNIFNVQSCVGHDAVFGDCNVINPGANISGGVQVGSYNLFGAGSIVLQYLHVGSGSVLGAGAVLTENLESKTLAVGVPAKAIKDL